MQTTQYHPLDDFIQIGERMKADAEKLTSLAERIKNNSKFSQWHPHTEIPADGFYIVCTESGAVFVSQPLGGKWMSQVRYWMELPLLPAEFVKK